MADSSKTERATPRRRQKARERGQVARSGDLITSLATVTTVLVLAWQAPGFAAQWRGLLRHTLEAASAPEPGSNSPLFVWTGYTFLRSSVLVIGLSWMAAMLGAVAQGGLVFAPSALAFNFSRLSPAARLEQLFSINAVSRLLKSLLPALAIVYLTVSIIRRDWAVVLSLPHLNAAGVAGFSLAHMFEVAWKSALVLVVWSGADYLLERQKLESDLRMSRQDLMDEFKETEGHPQIKGRIRRLQRQLRKRRMLEQVKRASVVITNPNEFAVALEYRPQMAAPMVVAKGRNLVARQIKELARWHSIPMIENPPLAHALYRAVEVGQSIPPKLYAVVATVLAAIYRAQQRAEQSAAPGAR